MAQRIQRKRIKGWRMPPNTVYVGRPTKWGNLYRLWTHIEKGELGELFVTPALSVALYRAYALQYFPGKVLKPLRGKNLCCWCPLDQPCHADVLLELANK